MKQLPSISVITPSFNQGQFIRETIDSVLSQDYPNLEYWVIDGGSSDSTLKILQSYDNKLNWISEKDAGQTDAINKGLRKATGEIMCYINSDDVFKPGALKLVGEAFLAHPDRSWLTGEYAIIDEDGKEIQSFIKKYKAFFRNLEQPWMLSILNYLNQPSTFWRRSAYKQVGEFDETLRFCMDYDYWFRLYKLSKPVLLTDVLSSFRVHHSSKGGSLFKQQFKEEIAVAKKFQHTLPLQWLHQLHAWATVQAYTVMKAP